MRFLADESLEVLVVSSLRDEGFDVASIREESPGMEDQDVLGRADREGRILVTNDKDFAELAFLQRQSSGGIVLLRLSRWRSPEKAKRLREAVREQGQKLRGVMTVVQERALRRRPLPPPGKSSP